MMLLNLVHAVNKTLYIYQAQCSSFITHETNISENNASRTTQQRRPLPMEGQRAAACPHRVRSQAPDGVDGVGGEEAEAEAVAHQASSQGPRLHPPHLHLLLHCRHTHTQHIISWQHLSDSKSKGYLYLYLYLSLSLSPHSREAYNLLLPNSSAPNPVPPLNNQEKYLHLYLLVQNY